MTHTVTEAATISRRSTKTIYRHIHEYQATKHLRHPRGLKATRPKNSSLWLIDATDLQKWLEGK